MRRRPAVSASAPPLHPYVRGLGEATAHRESHLERLLVWLSRCRVPLPPLALVADLGTLLSRPGVLDVPTGAETWAAAVARWARASGVEKALALDLPDAVVGALVASLARGIADPRGAGLSPGDVAALLAPALPEQATPARPAPEWATPDVVAQIEERLERLDARQLRRAAALGEGAGLSVAAFAEVPWGFLLPEARAAGAVAQRLMPVLRLSAPPRGTQIASVGGYADLTRRGEFDSLVLSELGLPEEEFFRRYAERELLHYGREAPPTHRPRKVAAYVDTGPLSWGAPRLLACGAALAMDSWCRRRGDAFTVAVGTGESQVEERPLDESGLLRLLSSRTWSLDAAPRIAALAQAQPRGNADVIAVLPSALVEKALGALRQAARTLRAFVVELAPADEVRLLQVSEASTRPLAQARVPPEIVGRAFAPAGGSPHVAAAAGALPFVRTGLWGSPVAARFSADGRHLLAVDSRGTLLAYATATGEVVATAAGIPPGGRRLPIVGLGVSGANEAIVSNAAGYAAFDVPSLRRTTEGTYECDGSVRVFAAGPDRTLATAGDFGIAVNDLGAPLRVVWRRHAGAGVGVSPVSDDVTALCVLPRGPTYDRPVLVAALAGGDLLAVTVDGSVSWRIALAGDGRPIVSLVAGGAGVVAAGRSGVWSVVFREGAPPTVRRLGPAEAPADAVALAPMGTHLAALAGYRKVAVRTADGRDVCTFEDVSWHEAEAADLSIGGVELALRGRKLRVWRTASADLAWETAEPASAEAHVRLSVSADGRRVILGCDARQGLFELFPPEARALGPDIAAGSVASAAPAQAGCAAFSPDGSLLAWAPRTGGLRACRFPIAGEDELRRLWHAGRTVRHDGGDPEVRAEGRPILHRSVAFSPDGRLVLAVGADAVARVYDARTLRKVRSFTRVAAHTAPVFLPGSTALALPTSRGFVLADLAGGRAVPSPWGDRPARQIAASPRGVAHAVLIDLWAQRFAPSRTRVPVAADEDGLAVADDGTLAVFSPRQVRLVRTDGQVTTMENLLAPPVAAAFGGPFLVVATAAGVATVFSARTGEMRAHLACGAWGALAVARSGLCAGSPDCLGRVVLSPSATGPAPTLDPAGAARALWEGP